MWIFSQEKVDLAQLPDPSPLGIGMGEVTVQDVQEKFGTVSGASTQDLKMMRRLPCLMNSHRLEHWRERAMEIRVTKSVSRTAMRAQSLNLQELLEKAEQRQKLESDLIPEWMNKDDVGAISSRSG